MKFIYIKESGHSKKTDKDYYTIRMALVDEKGIILCKSEPLFWITKEVFDNITL